MWLEDVLKEPYLRWAQKDPLKNPDLAKEMCLERMVELDKKALESIYTFTWVYIDKGPTKFVNKTFELYTNHSYGQGGLYHYGSHPKFMRSDGQRFYKHLQTHAIANGQDPDGSFE
uniref:Uncharacterized protein n=1 Tax=Rhodosorus marinus TaxID=101924 RepID=A0A7S0BQD0_9RHOD|mmetsp:Transcript_3006/g.4294  ORF Transcript_3006/g.4294 Transcript_3006/m.4294 type:complete len:116 (+) Transcript_3006:280-627(+)